jgi:hypothetical protein
MKVDIQQADGHALMKQIKPTGMSKQDRLALNACLMLSATTYCATVDGKGACIWGLVPPSLLSERAYLWLFTTDVANEHQFLLARHSQIIVQKMLEEYPILTGHCHIIDTRAQRWLKWLGAEFGFPQDQRVPFTIRKKQDG